MTARLPTPGGDDGDWGNILNTFLEVSHNADGTLNTAAIQNADGITTSQVGSASGVAGLNGAGLVPVAQLGSGTASSSNYLRGDGTWAVPGPTNDFAPWVPSDAGFISSFSIPDILSDNNDGAPSAGLVLFHRIPIRETALITNVCVGVSSAASSSASTGTYAGIYTLSGTTLTLQAHSADAGSVYAGTITNNAAVIPLTSTYTADPPYVYVALLFNMTDLPTLFSYGSRPMVNIGSGQRWFVDGNDGVGGITSLPPTFSTTLAVYFYDEPRFVAIS